MICKWRRPFIFTQKAFLVLISMGRLINDIILHTNGWQPIISRFRVFRPCYGNWCPKSAQHTSDSEKYKNPSYCGLIDKSHLTSWRFWPNMKILQGETWVVPPCINFDDPDRQTFIRLESNKHLLFWPKGIDRDRTRTCNPQIRSLVPYPLGHTVLYDSEGSVSDDITLQFNKCCHFLYVLEHRYMQYICGILPISAVILLIECH